MGEDQDINAKILAITKQISEQHPELLAFLNEMPVTIPDETNPEITDKILRDYYDSLEKILKGKS